MSVYNQDVAEARKRVHSLYPFYGSSSIRALYSGNRRDGIERARQHFEAGYATVTLLSLRRRVASHVRSSKNRNPVSDSNLEKINTLDAAALISGSKYLTSVSDEADVTSQASAASANGVDIRDAMLDSLLNDAGIDDLFDSLIPTRPRTTSEDQSNAEGKRIENWWRQSEKKPSSASSIVGTVLSHPRSIMYGITEDPFSKDPQSQRLIDAVVIQQMKIEKLQDELDRTTKQKDIHLSRQSTERIRRLQSNPSQNDRHPSIQESDARSVTIFSTIAKERQPIPSQSTSHRVSGQHLLGPSHPSGMVDTPRGVHLKPNYQTEASASVSVPPLDHIPYLRPFDPTEVQDTDSIPPPSDISSLLPPSTSSHPIMLTDHYCPPQPPPLTTTAVTSKPKPTWTPIPPPFASQCHSQASFSNRIEPHPLPSEFPPQVESSVLSHEPVVVNLFPMPPEIEHYSIPFADRDLMTSTSTLNATSIRSADPQWRAPAKMGLAILPRSSNRDRIAPGAWVL